MRDREFIILLDTFRRLIRRNAVQNIKKMLEKTHHADLSRIFPSLTADERLYIFNNIDDYEFKADFISELDETIAHDMLETLEPEEIVKIITQMPPDDQADLIGSLDEELESQILNIMKDKESEKLEELMMYPPESAGGIMVPLPFKMRENDTVQDTINSVHKQEDTEMIFYIYIVDEKDRLSGILSMRHLLTAKPETKLKDIMLTNVLTVSPETDQEEVARITSRYDLLALPVVDNNNVLLGIVTVDDIIDVLREEATEDFLQMAGVGKDREILLKTPFESARTRFPWLFATFLGGFISSFIISNFGYLVKEFILLSAFMPIVMGMGGNVGTQSSTIIVRGLSTGRIDFNHLEKVFFRQVLIGLILGATYGILLFLFTFLFNLGIENILLLSAIIGISLSFSMLIAASLGTITPLMLERFNVDPAVATGPIVTTVVDVLGVSAYFGIATLILRSFGIL
ncbi:MAG: magnesium transporter [Candidatus Marinimicrobia bacterium]|nr:magnesium transporter [Candidatus Neomarinimicrobiota bacterium]